MRIIRSAAELADYHREIPEFPGGVLVPTMGALHSGHEALIRQGVAEARRRGLAAGCVVTVFVNPTQFDEKHDFAGLLGHGRRLGQRRHWDFAFRGTLSRQIDAEIRAFFRWA